MNKDFLNELKKRLEEKRGSLERELSRFAIKDSKIEGNWKTKFPYFNGEVGSAAMEKAADQVEEYNNLLSIEHSLENKLKDVNDALEKIKKGTYGICEKCGKPISTERLKAFPEARYCKKCQEKIS